MEAGCRILTSYNFDRILTLIRRYIVYYAVTMVINFKISMLAYLNTAQEVGFQKFGSNFHEVPTIHWSDFSI